MQTFIRNESIGTHSDASSPPSQSTCFHNNIHRYCLVLSCVALQTLINPIDRATIWGKTIKIARRFLRPFNATQSPRSGAHSYMLHIGQEDTGLLWYAQGFRSRPSFPFDAFLTTFPLALFCLIVYLIPIPGEKNSTASSPVLIIYLFGYCLTCNLSFAACVMNCSAHSHTRAPNSRTAERVTFAVAL